MLTISKPVRLMCAIPSCCGNRTGRPVNQDKAFNRSGRSCLQHERNPGGGGRGFWGRRSSRGKCDRSSLMEMAASARSVHRPVYDVQKLSHQVLNHPRCAKFCVLGRGRPPPAVMLQIGAADSARSIREPALGGATRLFRHEGLRHRAGPRQVAPLLPGQSGDRFYKPLRSVVAGRQILRSGPRDQPAVR